MYKRIESAILEAKEERRLDFPAIVRVEDDRILIDTRWSRNPAKSNNGGEYFHWEEIWPNEYGDVLMQEFVSCDFWQPEDEPEVLGLTWDEVRSTVKALAAEHGVPVEKD